MRSLIESLEHRTLFASYSASTVTALISAINAANSSAAADTITLAAGGTFTFTVASDTTHNSTGLPRITDAGGLTIVGNGATLDRVATFGCRYFDVAPGASLTLGNLTMQNGVAYSSLLGDGTFTYGPAQGGAVFNEGSLVLNGVTIQNSTAQGAGGGFWGSAAPAADAAGGAVYSTGTLTLNGCTIRDNAAVGGPGESGGFIYADQGGRYYPGSDGGSAFGGGICAAGGSLSISNCVFTANTAAGGSGGNGYSFGTAASRYGGDAGDGLGGGLYASGASAALRNCTLSLNAARAGVAGLGGGGNKRYDGVAGHGIGGGIYRGSSASLALDDFTIAHVVDNTASSSSPNIAGSYKRLR